MKVNMTPNPLDVVTIHASQGDTEARQWEFELHNNGELIDTSDVKEQLVFKAYKGGTEQLLPENGSTPTTSPFLGDIRYPQGLLADQEFTYRQSPTESDGLAKITDIKGNTLNWNQIYNVNSDRTALGVNIKVVNGAVSITGTSNNIRTGPTFAWTDFKGVIGHKYIITKDFTLPTGDYIFDQYNLNSSTDITTVVFTLTSNDGYIIPQLRVAQSGVTYNISGHLCVYDLTKMFGAGNEPTTVEEFKSLFPLSYYSYNQGSLLSFMGNGIKTTGKNLVFKTISNSSINGSGVIISTSNFQMSVARVIKGKEYVITTNDNSKKVLGFYYEEPVVGSMSYNGERVDDSSSYTFTSPITGYVAFRSLGGYSTPMLEFGSSATSYEPYTSSTLSLPISTYFPTGMKDVPDYTNGGKIYDEMTSNKADTRVGSVDLGTLDWTPSNPSSYVFRGKLANLNAKIPNASDLPNALLANYLPYGYGPISGNNNGCFAIGYRNATDGNVIIIIDNNYSTLESFISHITGQFLFYELATPTETPITTASLVTENAEIPLSNEDGTLIGKCTEQLSENPGFIDAKIKLSDGDGECYSNKIQLHVERSPQ